MQWKLWSWGRVKIVVIFLFLSSFSFVEGDSGIPVTLGIRPKTWVKRRARLFEAWKNDDEKIEKIIFNSYNGNTRLSNVDFLVLQIIV